MEETILYTLGHKEKSAETFFNAIREHGIKTVIDVRLRNDSHILGFPAVKHLPYLLKEICGCKYRHELCLAPTNELFHSYVKKKTIGWSQYQEQFNALMKARKVETLFSADELRSACLLCREIDAATCHRSLVASYLQRNGVVAKVVHL